MKVGDYVKRPIEQMSKTDPPYEFGRLRLFEGLHSGSRLWLVHWSDTGYSDSDGARTWTLRREWESKLIPSSEQEYFKHCLRYGND